MTFTNRDIEATSRLRAEFEELRGEARKQEAFFRNKLPNDLAIMHIGGIAAAVTVAAASSTGIGHEKAAGAAASFGVGLAFVVLCMLYQWIIPLGRIMSISSAIRKLDRGEGTPDSIKRKSKEDTWLVVLSTAIMLASAFFFVYGAIELVAAVRARPSGPLVAASSSDIKKEPIRVPGTSPSTATDVAGSTTSVPPDSLPRTSLHQ